MRMTRIVHVLLILAIVLLAFPLKASAGQLPRIPNPSKPFMPINNERTSLGDLVVQDLMHGLTSEQLAGSIAGQGVTVMNVSFIGSQIAAGAFSGGSGIIGFEDGIILSSGSISNVIGPNQYDSISNDNGVAGDSDLNNLSGFPTYDASVLEFDFIPNQNSISFQFVFASDEYNEFVGSQFNDVFGFFVNGKNCAIIGGDPVAVNTINKGDGLGGVTPTNPELYLNNDLDDGGGFINTEMDGLTKVLTCYSEVVPNTVNHMKLAIADASDYILDSSVFIMNNSVTTVKRPIIVVPGASASLNPSCFFVKALFWEVPCLEMAWTWMPTAEEVYDPLLARLRAAGYTETNNYLSVFFYDWRKPVENNIERLRDRINNIKTKTNSEKVDLVGHSMGGLVSRAYIQSEIYDEDVAHLVTLGSPHYGSAKSYPYWEAADFYQAGDMETLAFSTIIAYYMKQDLNPVPVNVLRSRIPGIRDLMPTVDYLYNDGDNQVKPEYSLKQRNTNIQALNANTQQLLDRTLTATFYGVDHVTTKGFYVKDRPWWNLFTWDDGEPNWDRDLSDVNTKGDGDGTVLSTSAVINGAFVESFPVDHGGLPGDTSTINATLSFLGVSVAPAPVQQDIPRILAFFVFGPVLVTVTGPSGQMLLSTQEGAVASMSFAQEGIEVIESEDGDFKIIVLSDPVDGNYEVTIRGTEAGEYTLGYIKTAAAESGGPVSFEEIIQESTSTTNHNEEASYQIQFEEKADRSSFITAPEPIIELPLWAGNTSVKGLSVPNVQVKIFDNNTNVLLGQGTSDVEGRFDIMLDNPLLMHQFIYPVADGVRGAMEEANARQIYLPMLSR